MFTTHSSNNYFFINHHDTVNENFTARTLVASKVSYAKKAQSEKGLPRDVKFVSRRLPRESMEKKSEGYSVLFYCGAQAESWLLRAPTAYSPSGHIFRSQFMPHVLTRMVFS
jgi:hypothetical protein